MTFAIPHPPPSITSVETQALGFLFQRPDLPVFLYIVRLEDRPISSSLSTSPFSSRNSFSYAIIEQRSGSGQTLCYVATRGRLQMSFLALSEYGIVLMESFVVQY